MCQYDKSRLDHTCYLVEILMYSQEFLMIILEVLYLDGPHVWIIRDNCDKMENF